MGNLSATLLHDTATGKFTVFVRDYPGVIIQADTKDEAKAKLNVAWDNFIEYLKRRDHNFQFNEEEFVSNGIR